MIQILIASPDRWKHRQLEHISLSVYSYTQALYSQFKPLNVLSWYAQLDRWKITNEKEPNTQISRFNTRRFVD